MSVIWTKVWHDLWHNKARTLLAVLSITSGVFAIGAIFGMVDQLLAGMDAAHQAVAPSHINIILRDFVDEPTADSLTSLPGVVDVDPVNQISVRYKRGPDDEWALGTLVMRDDYDAQIYDQLVLKEGAWPADRSIGVERLTSQFFDMGIGDEIVFEMDGVDRPLTINGLIRHPFVPPPPFGGQPHFFTDAAGLARFGIPEGRYGQLLVQVAPYSRDFAQEIAGDIRARLGDQGIGVVVTLYQEPERHWGRMFVEGVTVVLQVMAVVSLFLSVVLVANTMTAVITQQTDQIGVIKAIGGGSGIIVQVYLAGVLAYGALALLVSLPLGAFTAFAASRWFLNIFNIDYEQFQIAPRALLLQAAAALLAPLLAALWPVLKGAAISVREAIASYGLGGDFGSSRFDQFIDRLGARFLTAAYAAALGNMFRRKGRLTLTLLVLVTAGVTFMVVMSLISSTTLTLDNDMARRGYDFYIGFDEAQRTERVVSMAQSVSGVTAAEVWYSRNATILREGERLQDSAGLGAQLTGIPPQSAMRRPLIVDGRWLQPGDGSVIVVNLDTATDNDIAVGDTVSLDLGDLGDDEWQVVGVYKEVYEVGFAIEPIYAPLDAVAQATKQVNEGTQLYVQTDWQTPGRVTAVADALKTLFESRQMDVNLYTTALKVEERQEVDNQFASIVQILLGVSMLMASVGGIGLMGSLGISVVERTREIGVMRAIGAPSRTIMTVFIMEGLLQGVFSWLISVPLAFLLAQPMARLLGRTMIEVELDYAFSGTAVLVWLLTIIFISILASILPARRATRISVQESLAYA